MTKRVSIRRVSSDIWHNIDKKEFWVCLIISFLLSTISLLINFESELTRSNILSIFPSLVGCTIAGYAIIINLKEETVKRLEDKVNGEQPYEVLCASFSFAIILQLVPIFLSLYCPKDWYMVDSSIYTKIIPFLVLFFSLFSLLWIGNLALHLFALRMFILSKEQKK
ncbi:hypothetical protein [Bacteroides sp. UBA939]|uniref:hypothetical protein n=1 Tax=Bacteroides sp. UBA939 TaxID=1946092 RepID=UPI0025C49998|nr:hypothetical protein [Bacteroides sp. UBA939]